MVGIKPVAASPGTLDSSLRTRKSRLLTSSAVSVMALGMATFLLVGSNALLYSALLGLGYGLALPSVRAVNVSDESVRPRVLPMAGLLFQAAIIGWWRYSAARRAAGVVGTPPS